MKNADVIIIGGGHVGTSLALALRDKADVILIDSLAPADRAHPKQDNRIFALAEGTKRVLETLGVWGFLSKTVAPIAHIHVSNKGSFGASRLHASDFSLPAMGYMCASADLQWSLQQAAVGIDHRYPATCVAINPTAGTVTLNTGELLSANMIIATDGQSSTVRQQLGIATHHKDYAQSAIVARVELTVPHHDTAYERFVDDGAIALLPYGPQACALIWSLPSAQGRNFMAMDDTHFIQILQQAFGYRLGTFRALSQRYCYPLVHTQAQRIHQGTVVLLGNAAQTLHPIAAQGFNLALRQVALFADLYAANPSASMIQAYAARQAQDTQHTRLFTEGLVRFFSDEGVGRFRVVRGGLLTAFDLCPPAKRYLLKGVMKDGALGKNACNTPENSLK